MTGDTRRLGALLHEQAIGCWYNSHRVRYCEPNDDHHARHAARLIAQGVRVGERPCNAPACVLAYGHLGWHSDVRVGDDGLRSAAQDVEDWLCTAPFANSDLPRHQVERADALRDRLQQALSAGASPTASSGASSTSDSDAESGSPSATSGSEGVRVGDDGLRAAAEDVVLQEGTYRRTLSGTGRVDIVADPALAVVPKVALDRLRAALEAELVALPPEAEMSDFDRGAGAAYHWCLSALAGPAPDDFGEQIIGRGSLPKSLRHLEAER